MEDEEEYEEEDADGSEAAEEAEWEDEAEDADSAEPAELVVKGKSQEAQQGKKGCEFRPTCARIVLPRVSGSR